MWYNMKAMKPVVLLIIGACIGIYLLTACNAQDETEDNFREMSWEEIEQLADGQDLYWYMWGGSSVINRFVEEYVTKRLLENFNITLHLVPVSDTALAVSKVQGEEQAGRDSGGAVDLIWINGENFRSMHSQDLLYGPYADILPNNIYVNHDDPAIKYDFGYPVDNYESAYGTARIAFIYDSAAIEPFKRFAELLPWVQQNPGLFTYPAIPDFTGSAFVRHIFYYIAGGYEEFQGEYREEVYQRYAQDVWDYLNQLEPYLWRGGETYPENRSQLQILYEHGEIAYDITYHPNDASIFIKQGRYPESSRTLILDDGTIGNTHFVAIPYNASHKPAALVAANFLLEPSTQFEKNLSDVWGDYPAIDLKRLSPEWREKFLSVPIPPSVLQTEDVLRKRLPEMHASWLGKIEQDWIEQVLQN